MDLKIKVAVKDNMKLEVARYCNPFVMLIVGDREVLDDMQSINLYIFPQPLSREALIIAI